MAHADDEPVTYGYGSSANITFRGEGIELGVTWGEWRAMPERERNQLLNEKLWELAQIYIEDDE